MARLPIPGSDDGQWGDVLNDFLLVAHTSSGTLESDAVSASNLQDSSVTDVKLSATSGSNGQVLTKNTGVSGGLEWTSAAGSPDATTSSKGIVQLAGDLAGTAAAPTVPGLAGKQASSAELSAIAALIPANDDLLQRKSGAWTNRTPAQVKTDLALTKSDVGLGNVDNTSDANKPVSTAQQTALNLKADKTTTISAGTGLTGGGDLSANRTLTVSYGTTAGTAAQGNDSRITGAIQSTIVDAKGDLVAATAADTVARLAVGTDGQILTADSTQTTGLRWATAAASSGGLAEYYPISAYGFVAIADTVTSFTVGATFESHVVRMFVPAGKAITAAGVLLEAGGSVGAGGLNSFAIYDDAGTLVAATPTDDTLFTSSGWRFKDFSSPIAAQGSDRFVRVHANVSGYSSLPTAMYSIVTPSSGAAFNSGYNMPNHRRSVYTSAVSSFPASFTPSSYGNVYQYLPLLALG